MSAALVNSAAALLLVLLPALGTNAELGGQALLSTVPI